MRYFLLLLFSISIYSQVVNIESKRMRSDTTGWSGSAEANFQLSKTTEEIYDLGARLHFQFKHKNYLWLFLNEYRLIKGAGTEFVNSGFAHVRYNHKVTKELLRWEVFTQVQFNGALDVGLRGLAGTGPRFKIYDSDEFRFYAASLYMFEYQENVSKTIIERNHRSSSYLSFTIDVGKVEFSNTTYWQPKVNYFKNYRIHSQTDLLFEIFEQLDFKTGFTYRYDTRPFPGIPKSTYYLMNGLVFEF
ncbi:MAG: DUF481 domain-containing protein [Chlorobi bacterium]|nr:DUF481 domain-containing protein [Chlorobiota bacterium]MCI0716555.1 DUF481 domain-containing protein [Chlorobiota bacterium]